MPFELEKFMQLAKVEETSDGRAIAWGISTAEVPDCDNEIADYDDSVDSYKQWSQEAVNATTVAGQEVSLGNIRLQHGLQIAGKATKIDYNAAKRQIWLGAEAVDSDISDMLRRGFLTGYSHAGSYKYRRCNNCRTDVQRGSYCPQCAKDVAMRYAPKISEVSFVDRPCLPIAHFAYVKADGSTELRKFADAKPAPAVFIFPPITEDQCRRAAAGEDPQLSQEQLAAFEQFAIVLGKGQPRHPGGQFAARASGPMHDCLSAAGYEHTRTGTSADAGSTESAATTHYTHQSGARVTVTGDSWTHEDGKGRTVRGSGMDSLANHITTCHPKQKAAADAPQGKDVLDMDATEVQALIDKRVAEVVNSNRNVNRNVVVITKFEGGRFYDGAGNELQVADNVARYFSKADAEKERTKRVAGEDLTADCFLIVGDPEDTSTWKLPVKFSSESKTKRHIRNAIARFDQMTDVSEADKKKAWRKLVALAKKYGIEVSDEEDSDNSAKAMRAEMRKELHEILAAADTSALRKDMGAIAMLAQMLQQIKWLQQSCAWEGEYENDERDFAIAEQIGVWLNDGVDLLSEMVEHEGSELTEPALKAAFQREGDEDAMNESLLKAAKSLGAHFKKAAAHHAAKAEHHEQAAGLHEEIADAHKALAEHHKSMGGEHEAHKGMHSEHMKLHKAHTAKAAHHMKLHKLHKAMAEHTKGMGEGLEESTKTAGTDDDLIKAITTATSEMVTEKFGDPLAKAASAATALEGLDAKIEAAVKKAFDAQIVASGIDPATGKPKEPTLITRPTQDPQVQKAQRTDGGATGGL